MKLFIACLLFCRAALAQVSPYDPRTDGSWTTYAVFEVGGYWDYGTRELGLAWKKPTGQLITIWWRNTKTPAYGDTELLGEWFYAGDASVLSNPANVPGQIIYDAVGVLEGYYPYIGEIGNPPAGMIGTPGEPKLPLNPKTSDYLELTHQGAISADGSTQYESIRTNFRVIGGPGTPWAQWPDCVWTSLEERPGDPNANWVYNYVFARGLGLVDLWYGNLRQGQTGWYFNGKATSFEIYAIAWGQTVPPK